MRATYTIRGMHCGSCEQKVTRALAGSPHVKDVDVSLAGGRAVIESDDQLSVDALNQRLADAGGYYLEAATAQRPQDPPASDGIGASPQDAGYAAGAEQSAPAEHAEESHSSEYQPAQGVDHQPEKNRFAMRSGGEASVLEYQRPDDQTIDLAHTFVPPSQRGQGQAGKLADSALRYARSEGLRVVASCSYVRGYIDKHSEFQELLDAPADRQDDAAGHAGHEHQDRTWLETYRPLLIIVGYLLGGVAVAGVVAGTTSSLFLMSTFMGLFFVVFSFFKMLDLPGFAQAYTSYDLIAARWLPYAFLYPFIELGLGVWYLLGWAPVAVNVATLIVMLVSTAGVVNAVARGRDIQCGCLGTVFDLPMSTVTIVEDATMALMAAGMLVMLLS